MLHIDSRKSNVHSKHTDFLILQLKIATVGEKMVYIGMAWYILT